MLILLLLSGILPCAHARAQVNTEKLRRADTATGVFFRTSLSFGIVRGNSEYVNTRGAARFDYVRTGNDNFVVVNYEFKESSQGKIANKGFVHLRSIWETTSLLSLEGFTQAEFNEFLSLKNRDLLGGGARLHVLELDTAGHGGELSVYLGIGAMFEHEEYSTSPEETRYDRARSTNYLTINWLPAPAIFFSFVGYVQPLLSDPGDYRITSESSLAFTLSSAFSFNVRAVYRYHSRPVTSVKRYDVELTNGITYVLP